MHVDICAHKCAFVRPHIFLRACTNAHVRTNIGRQTDDTIHANITRIYINKHKHFCTRTCMLTHSHTHVRACACAHTYTQLQNI